MALSTIEPTAGLSESGSPLDPRPRLPYSSVSGESSRMRALWSTVVVWACLSSCFGCGESPTDTSLGSSSSNGGQLTSTGGILGGGGVIAVGGTQNPGGSGNGGLLPTGGSLNGSGGLLVGNGGVPNGTGGLLDTGGFVGGGGLLNTGGLLDTGGFIGSGGSQPATGGAPPGTGGGNPGPYPAGPYGVAVGNTFPNIQLQGYVNDSAVGLANTKPFVALYTMDDLRVSGARYALIHNSEFF